MNMYKWSQLTEDKKERIMKRAEIDISKHMELAREVSERIKNEGDDALLYFTQKFDNVTLSADKIKVTAEEIQQGYERLDTKTREAIQYAATNIKNFHQKQMPEPMWFTYVDDGIMAGEKVTPIEDVCLYVPRGKGSFPSVLLMLAIPAKIAGVGKIIVITPPNEQGDIDDTLLAAAKISGISEIYKGGGIQAVAAVAFGTQTVPKCHKIIGPGNSYATAAKRVLASYIDAGLPAGPSECIILADEYANPHNVALDWMIEAEHGPDSASLLVTHSQQLAQEVSKVYEQQLQKLSSKRRQFIEHSMSNYGGIVLTENIEQSVDFVNQYAPEHMEIMTKNPFDILPHIKNAGEILMGGYTPVTLCNFLLGPNAILPTGGFAKTYSSVSVHDFLKRSSVGYVSKEGFERVRENAYIIAKAEGFDSHAMAVKERKIDD